MKITIENETGKHYICLDRPDYTCYPEEREVLLQAGISAKVEFTYQQKYNGKIYTVFNVYISEKQIRSYKRRAALKFMVPFLVFFTAQITQAKIFIYNPYTPYRHISTVMVVLNKFLAQIALIPLILKF